MRYVSIPKGGTLSKIAQQEHIPLKVLLFTNANLDPRRIQIGQKIAIPETEDDLLAVAEVHKERIRKTIESKPEKDVGNEPKRRCKQDCSKKFHKISKIILKHEGGFVNDPNDPGGATNRGIAWPTWKKYAKKDLGIEPTLTNLKKLSEKDAEIIYRKRYWEPKGFCLLENDKVGLMVYDWTITSGGATKKIQQLLKNEFGQNITVDGSMGKQTIQALNNVKNQEKLLQRITEIRKQYYKNLAYKNGQKTKLYKFLKGWLHRVDDCLKVGL